MIGRRSISVSPAKASLPQSRVTVTVTEAPLTPDVPLDKSQIRRVFDAFMLLCRANSAHRQADNPSCMTAFHSVVEPGVSLADYMMKLDSQVKFGDECLFVSLMLMGRYCRALGSLPSTLSAHRLFVAAMRVATKLQHDLIRSNRTFARFGGLQLAEMNYLESQFLSTLQFKLWFSADDFEHVRRRTMQAVESSVDMIQISAMADAMQLESPLVLPTHVALGSPAIGRRPSEAESELRSPSYEFGKSPDSVASPYSGGTHHNALSSSGVSHRLSLSTEGTVAASRRRTSSTVSVSTLTNPAALVPLTGPTAGNGLVAARSLRGP